MPASTIVAGYLFDRAGVPLRPALMLAVLLASGAGAYAWLRRQAEWRARDVVPFLTVVLASFGWFMWIAAPSFLPLGSGSDLTHHLTLIDYIEQHWQLVHDRRLEIVLGEMASYTPGSHLLTALVAAWAHTSGLQALHGVVSASVALKVGFVFLIALRSVGGDEHDAQSARGGVPICFALLACVFLFASQVYFLRSFVENSFVAQVVSELFAIVMWWSLVVWDVEDGRRSAWLFGLAGAATFLTWPVWTGPLVVAGAVVAFLHGRASAVRLVIAIVPIATVGGLYLADRQAGMSMAATSGAAPWPELSNYGLPFLLLSAAGLVVSVADRRARVTAILAAAIGAQSLALYLVATRAGADAPYLSLKMLYFLLYPQAVAAALCVSAIWRMSSRRVVSLFGRFAPERDSRFWLRLEAAAAAVLVAWAASVVARPLAGAPRSLTVLRHPAVSAPLERAGRWARANLPPHCVEYLVDDSGTAYWLHLAVLGNPRASPRSVDSATFEPGWAIARWLTPGGLPFAIADLPALPRGVRDELDIVQQFETAAVVKRDGPSSCGPP